MTQLSAGAVHESSHYICSLLNGARVRCVQIDTTNVGHEGLWRNDVDCQNVLTQAVVIMLLAGLCGEARHTNELNIKGAGSDFRQLMLSLLIKGHKDIEMYSHESIFAEYSGPANKFIAHPLRWTMILEFAAELQKKREISGQNAFNFVEREVKTWSMQDQLEFWYPVDGLGGDALPGGKHGT